MFLVSLNKLLKRCKGLLIPALKLLLKSHGQKPILRDLGNR